MSKSLHILWLTIKPRCMRKGDSYKDPRYCFCDCSRHHSSVVVQLLRWGGYCSQWLGAERFNDRDAVDSANCKTADLSNIRKLVLVVTSFYLWLCPWNIDHCASCMREIILNDSSLKCSCCFCLSWYNQWHEALNESYSVKKIIQRLAHFQKKDSSGRLRHEGSSWTDRTPLRIKTKLRCCYKRGSLSIVADFRFKTAGRDVLLLDLQLRNFSLLWRRPALWLEETGGNSRPVAGCCETIAHTPRRGS